MEDDYGNVDDLIWGFALIFWGYGYYVFGRIFRLIRVDFFILGRNLTNIR